jgi:hypothetical protein
VLNVATIQGVVFGDNGLDTSTGGTALQRLQQAVAMKGSFSANAPGEPIAYSLRHLSGNTPCNPVLEANSFKISGCRRPIYRVRLLNLTCPSNSDPGNEAEIMGDIGVTTQPTDLPAAAGSKTLWRADDPGENIALRGGVNVKNTEVSFSFPTLAGASLRIQGSMWEDDNSGNYGMGSIDRKIDLANITFVADPATTVANDMETFSGDGETVQANFLVYRQWAD